MTAPEKRPARSSAMIETTGMSAFFTAWRTSTICSRRPLARAVRMKSARTTSRSDEREPEHRHRDAQERSGRGREVEEAVLLDRAVHAERQCDDGREHERDGHELERRRQSLQDHLAHRTAGREADPEVAAQNRGQPAHVLDRHGLVESEPLPERLDDLWVD